MIRAIIASPARRTVPSNQVMACDQSVPPRKWIDTFPVTEATPDHIAIQIDPVEPLDRRWIERRLITGGQELQLGDWVRLTAEVIADPRNGLRP